MINFEEIKNFLPQKFPYYMVDRIIELKEREKVVGIKNITGNEIHFLGHFPDTSIFPGTMILEVMAQTATFLFYSKSKRQKMNPFLGVVKEARFLKPVLPGDQLRVTVLALRTTKDNAYVKATAKVEESIVAQSDMIFVRRK
ncbi:MAG: 3-hydroxyacyl-ACP dehydratase FabZ [Candidatus Omnitrophica bacterium]|nr:3-hydroxyacyl-ACP dehydratase FabZ [Candidatus Omnitrophota bacterium]